MRRGAVIVPIVVLTVAVGAAVSVLAQRAPTSAPSPGTPAQTTAKIVAAAQAVLSSLDDAGRAKAQFPFDGPQKTRWSNLPTGIFRREGLRLGDLSAPQRTAVMSLLAAALSPSGYQKVTGIMRADETLRQTSGGGGGPRGGRGGGPAFGENEYYLAFVGAPSTTAPWMLQFGGHHLGINLTIGGSQATMAPSHTGVQPAAFSLEGRTIRPLGAESDKAFALVNALTDDQRKQAILTSRVADLVLGPRQDGRAIQPEGIRGSALTQEQQTMLLGIIREWAGIAADAYSEPRSAELRASVPQTYFAWSGPLAPGSVSYFRIQAPTLVIEFAPQRDVDHIHTIYRDPTNDYGAKFVRQ